ncbi:Vacuolar protein-sorting-associated protein 36 [Lobulomyces angularis]|nr:Vacuolar protein-sorting-associated protein 36 [Lobulomyces angularis]
MYLHLIFVNSITYVSDASSTITYLKVTCNICSTTNFSLQNCSNCGVKPTSIACPNCTYRNHFPLTVQQCEICTGNLYHTSSLSLPHPQYLQIQNLLQSKLENSLKSLENFKSPTPAGLTSIFNSIQLENDQTETYLNNAFTDLDTLIKNADEMVKLAEVISSKLANTSNQYNDDDVTKFKSYLVNLGISQPVTKESAGDSFSAQLANELSEFLSKLSKGKGNSKFNGMISLTDIYCLINRARGVALISPQDLYKSCLVLEKSGIYKLRTFESGLIVIHDKNFDEDQICLRIQSLVKNRKKLTPSIFAIEYNVSVLVAKEMLIIAESVGIIARDDSIEGLAYYENLFLTEF